MYFHPLDEYTIITEAELIIKGDATVQLRISAVLLRKPGRQDAPYALIVLLCLYIIGNSCLK